MAVLDTKKPPSDAAGPDRPASCREIAATVCQSRWSDGSSALMVIDATGVGPGGDIGLWRAD